MDEDLVAPALLSRKGLGPRCVEVLETHDINSIEVFRMLREEHVVKLQEEGLSVGIHAKLWQLWEQEHQGFNSGQLLACWVSLAFLQGVGGLVGGANDGVQKLCQVLELVYTSNSLENHTHLDQGLVSRTVCILHGTVHKYCTHVTHLVLM